MNLFAMLAADENVALGFRAAFEPRLVPKRKPKPAVIQISLGSPHPDDESFIVWSKYHFNRDQAAKALRYCRAQGLLIEPGWTGYSISEVGRDEEARILAETT